MTRIQTPKTLLILLLGAVLYTCEDEPATPKPHTYLDIKFSAHKLKEQKGAGPYEFSMPDTWVMNEPVLKYDGTYSQDEIDVSSGIEYKRKINERFDMDKDILSIMFRKFEKKETLTNLLSDSYALVEREKIKSDKIISVELSNDSTMVYGALFELQGDGVGTPFQFYLTDSSENYIHASVLYSYDKYEAAKPLLEHLKKGLLELIHTFKWVKD